MSNDWRYFKFSIIQLKSRCAKFAESVYELSPDPVLLIGAKPKKRDTCAINSRPTIVGGELASAREFPHMALIGYGDYPIKWRCAGSLISDRWVISAAHCTVTPDNLVAKYVLLGDLNVTSKIDDLKQMANPKIYQIVGHRNHPGYKKPLGDSGGPLQQALQTPYCMYTLIGLTSVGNKCAAGAPGVYTRIRPYLSWIESTASF
ncbi:unnamed protein product [Nesidiocoris tenuis]|uniref:Peptidase S1 domain-containing protein n=1 Tax=Nesidiocoris tenuis TaxID=355587 RepID=A0A6H5GDI0_9HEMI|nr:unnamed protein product [Nesidiocoris tenuis]